MQVMEPGAQLPPLQVPFAEIVGLQFGLATSKEFLGFSVIKSRCKDTLKNLVDPRLGLPAENEICATCGGTNYDECTGHFAHVKLTQPIFHPNHMRLVQRILQKICLACGVPKEKKKKINFSEETGHTSKQNSLSFEREDVNGDRGTPVIVEAVPIETEAAEPVIELSSDDEIPPDILQIIPQGPMDFTLASTSQSAMMRLPLLGSSKSKGKAHANGSSHFEVTTNGSKKSAIGSKKSGSMKSPSTQGHAKSSKKIYKGRPAGLDVLNADNLRSRKTSACLHCSPGNSEYRPILVKILPVKGRKIGDSSEILQLEVQDNEDDVWLPGDFWAFLGGPARLQDDENKVPTKHVLSPSEAYTILKKIPERAISKLGMNRDVARPEALIMKCVPIPPNCTRTTDYKYISNTTTVQFGSDNVTRTLQNLVTEIGRIHRTRTGKAMSRAQREESTTLQILTSQYLREKGAPKAVAGKEPLKRDRNGRVTKQDDHRWTKEWLSDILLGKSGNFTAKAVIAGDPSLGIEEIGVPWAVAQKLTTPERATQWNCGKLQEYVDSKLQEFRVLQELSPHKGKPGATRIERGGQAFQVLLDSAQTHKVQIGDIVHRNIRDGDYVYVNRPPSVHKHSLMALKVHVHYGLVITVNPLVCSPFSADFDGDIFHLYVPQSLQAIAELEQLMAVPQQIVSDHGGQPLLGLTQDTLLAAHLLTTSKLFVDKASMHQLCLWSSKQPPEAAIVKSPKGGPFWTGEQVFGLTLPAKLNMGSSKESILIQGGEILKWIDGTKLLRKENESIASALCFQLGPEGLVDYLNNAAGLLHAWLQVQGFSTGLTDFQVTNNSAARQKMLQSIFEEYYMKSIQESCDSVRILDAKVQAMGPDIIFNTENLTKNVRFLEQAAQQIFRARESDAESILAKYAEKNNSLLVMVKSGSKGSRGKLLQQIVGMGLQLYKGKHLLPFSSSRRPSTSNSPVLDWWEDKGLVRSSLVDGLSASELFNHVTADRTGILRKHVEVAQPGTLFKSLMLFLRDLHVVYDGSVRSQCGNKLVQFCYGGAIGVPRRTVSKRGSFQNQLGMDDPITPLEEAEGDLTWEEDDRRRWPLSVLAGEPVGVLAATAISQPAYELMLDAPSLDGPFMPRPLELVQETLYPREKSDLKPSDRCVIIRLVNCLCTKPFCLERRVLDVQAFLTRITLKTLAVSSVIQFWNMEDFRLAGTDGEDLRLGSPWLGHIKLSLDMMKQHQVDVRVILERLREKFSATVTNAKKQPMGQIFFCSSFNCNISNGCCLHFSPRLPKKLQNQKDSELYNAALLTLLMKIRRTIIPGLLGSTVKGDERLESVRIVSEGPTRTTWHNKLTCNRDLDEELVLEIVVAPTKSKLKRSMPWTSVKEACLPLMDMVDWNRSMPYSIQEIRHSLGIETAYQMVTRRLGLVLEKTAPHTNSVHVKLIADMMTFSGDANGFNITGFQDMNKVTAVSAPFTEASFKNPIRTLLDAAGKGATDSLEGVMTNCVWGKEAPLGTGSCFDLFWQPSKDMRRVATSGGAEKDVHAIWKDLDEKCIPDKVIPSSPTHSLPGLDILPERNLDLDEGAGFSPQHAPNFDDADDTWGSSHQNNNGGDGDSWGNSPVAKEDDGGWGNVGKTSNGNGFGDWDQLESTDGKKGQGEPEEIDGWGSVGKEKDTSGNSWDDKSAGDTQGGWGDDAAKTGTEGGWGDDAAKTGTEGGWGDDAAKKSTEGGWGEDAAKKNTESGWGDDAAKKSTEGGWGDDAAKKSTEGGWGDDAAKKSTEGGWGDDATKKSTEGGWGDDAAKKSTEAGWGDDAVKKSTEAGWGDDPANTSTKGGWGDDAANTSTKGGWGDDAANTGTEGGWGDEGDVSNEGRLRPSGDRKQINEESGQRGNNSDWGASQAVQEGEGGGWDSVSTEVPEGDGWDSFARPQTDRSRRSGPEHTGHRHGSGAEDNLRHFSGHEENRGSERTWTSGGGGRDRGREGRGNDWGPTRTSHVSGANVTPIGVRRQIGSSQEQNVGERSPRSDSLSLQQEKTSSIPSTQDPTALPQSPDQDPTTDSGVNWSELVSGTTKVDAWESFKISEGNGAGSGMGARHRGRERTDRWHGSSAEDNPSQERHFRARGDNRDSERPWTSGGNGRGWGRGGRGNDWERGRGRGPREVQQEVEPECKEIDDLVKSMRGILRKNEIGGRLSDKDDEAVQAVLAYHPNLTEKTGCGVAYIKVDSSQDYPDVQCFWLVRTDGSEDEFSFHKCLKEKTTREFPSFLDRYDDLYTGRNRRPRAPAANFVEGHAAQQEEIDGQAAHNPASPVEFSEGHDAQQEEIDTQVDHDSSPAMNVLEGHAAQQEEIDTQADHDSAPAASSMEEGRHGEQYEDVDAQADEESAPVEGGSTQASRSNW